MTTKNIEEKLAIVRNHLKSGSPEKALTLIGSEARQPELANARGVCLMRLNKIGPALEAFKEVVFQGYICMPATTPALYKANYSTALILKGLTSTALELEKSLKADDSHPYISELKQAVQNWKKSLPWPQRLLCCMNIYPNKPLPLPFEPGGI